MDYNNIPLTLLSLSFLLIGCANRTVQGTGLEECNSDASCGSGYTCRNNICVNTKADFKIDGQGYKKCNPKQLFCVGNQLRECSDDGKTSKNIVENCSTLNFSDLKFTCIPCPAKRYSTCSANKSHISGEVTGMFSFTANPVYGSCNYGVEPIILASVTSSKSMSLYIAPNYSKGEGIGLIVPDLSKIKSGVPFIFTPTVQTAMAFVIRKGDSCYPGYGSLVPPSKSEGTISWNGTTQGSSISVNASAYVYCLTSKKWEHLTIKIKGKIYP